MRIQSMICVIATLIFIASLCGKTNAQGVSGYTSIDYYEDTNEVDAYSETDLDGDLVGNYDAKVTLTVTDQNSTLIASGSMQDTSYQGFAYVELLFSGAPDSTYTAVGAHKAVTDMWDWDPNCYYRSCIFYYDDWFFSSFQSQNINAPWYYYFLSPAFQETHIYNPEITVGTTYDSDSVQTPKPVVDIFLNGSRVTRQTVNVIVGQKMNLTTSVQPSNGTVTNSQWTVPGGDSDRIANWVVVPPPPGGYTPTSATVTHLTTLTNSSVDFYWITGGNGRTLQYTAKVNGTSVQALVTFNVQRPTAQISITTSSTNIGVDSLSQKTELRLGNPDTTPGLTFTRTLSIPSGFNGTTQWVQVFTKKSASRTDSSGQVSSQNSSGLDDFYPYPLDPGATSTNSKTSDTPALFLSGLVAGSVDFEATMWLLFRPTAGTNPIWVPLRQVSWVWTANATYDGTTWTINSHSDPTNLSDSDSTSHPQWTTNAH